MNGRLIKCIFIHLHFFYMLAVLSACFSDENVCHYFSGHVSVNCCCWLQGYKPADEAPSEYQSIPLNKIEDFGVHCKA